jgi:hypothetical protein
MCIAVLGRLGIRGILAFHRPSAPSYPKTAYNMQTLQRIHNLIPGTHIRTGKPGLDPSLNVWT